MTVVPPAPATSATAPRSRRRVTTTWSSAAPPKSKARARDAATAGSFLLGLYEVAGARQLRQPHLRRRHGWVRSTGSSLPSPTPSTPPGEWNTFDIIWKGPVFDGEALVPRRSSPCSSTASCSTTPSPSRAPRSTRNSPATPRTLPPAPCPARSRRSRGLPQYFGIARFDSGRTVLTYPMEKTLIILKPDAFRTSAKRFFFLGGVGPRWRGALKTPGFEILGAKNDAAHPGPSEGPLTATSRTSPSSPKSSSSWVPARSSCSPSAARV